MDWYDFLLIVVIVFVVAGMAFGVLMYRDLRQRQMKQQRRGHAGRHTALAIFLTLLSAAPSSVA